MLEMILRKILVLDWIALVSLPHSIRQEIIIALLVEVVTDELLLQLGI